VQRNIETHYLNSDGRNIKVIELKECKLVSKQNFTQKKNANIFHKLTVFEFLSLHSHVDMKAPERNVFYFKVVRSNRMEKHSIFA
jgi:hypothetical protein